MNEPHRFEIIERIEKKIPRQCLASYPTPLAMSERLTAMLGGPKLWLKRDDLISFGLGGNKIRGLEVMLADAQQAKADTLITGAGVQSNHVRATAFAAAQASLDCIAVYWGRPPPFIEGNYRVTRMLNALCHFTHDDNRESVDRAIEKISAEMEKRGKRPYPIPRGGGCMMGVLGHVLAVFEAYRQCAAVAMNPDAIVMAVGSGGTYAGWLVGTKLLKLPWRLMGYSVSRDPFEASQQVVRLANQALDWLGFDYSFTTAEAPIIGGFIGPGYGLPSPEGAEAIKQVAAGGGILLDPVYTGKAMAGYIHGCADGLFDECKNVIFLHTGGEPAFFAGQGEWLSLNARSI